MKKKQTPNILKMAFAFCLFIFLPYSGQADNIVLDHPIDSFINIAPYTFVYVDKTASLELEAVRDLQRQNAFVPLDSLQLAGKYICGKYRYWLYFNIKNGSEKELAQTVFSCGKHDRIDIYKIENGAVIKQRIGTARRIENRNRLFPNKYSVPLHFAPLSGNDIFVKLTHNLACSIPSPILLNDRYEFEKETKGLTPFFIFHTAFFSLLIFVFLFTLPQYFQNKEKAFLYYSLYVLLLFVFYFRSFDINNPVTQFLPPWISDYKYYIPISLLPMLAYLFFISSFLNTRKDFPEIHKLVKLCIVFLGIYFLLDRAVFFYDKWLAWKLDNILRVGFLLFSIYFLLLLLKSKSKLAKYILSGTLVLVLASFSNMLLSIFNKSNYIGYWNFTLIPQYAGIGLELLFFSLGLGYKTRLMEKEKNAVQQKLENEKREKIHQKELNRVRNAFFTNITHEFRTPLTLIIGLADELKENAEAVIHKKAAVIRNNGAKLLSLVNRLLSLSKLEAGKMEPEYKQADIISFLKYQVNAFRSLSDSMNISLVFYSEKEEFIMAYDADKLQTIVSNLISNAIKFSQEYGEIIVLARIAGGDKKILEIMVKDNGQGIGTADLPHIFERFYQADNPTRQGTGIGLALAKELVELMGGTIRVFSEVGKGAEFTLRLPIYRELVPACPSLPPQGFGTGPPIGDFPGRPREVGKNTGVLDEVLPTDANAESWMAGLPPDDSPLLLLVEDNADVRFFIKSCLEKNYRTLEADNGEKGIELAIEHVPDLIISDVMMPGKDGFELCRELKEHGQTDHIPIILLTAKATQEDKNLGLYRGADAYLIKPFDKKELLIRVEKLIEIRKKLEARFWHIAGQGDGQPDPDLNDNPFLLALDEILEKNYADDSFSAPALCRCMGISKSRLYEQLKKESGLSVGLYIRSFRLRKAKGILMKNNKKISVKEVAYKVGFSSPVYFSQEFKKAFGRSPGSYKPANGK
ncbi:MAG TPA: response regulator [Bacteroidetes bacterium]|nr:response regulator [Bacteroidota bacterium]